jgi:hypothetical protein
MIASGLPSQTLILRMIHSKKPALLLASLPTPLHGAHVAAAGFSFDIESGAAWNGYNDVYSFSLFHYLAAGVTFRF